MPANADHGLAHLGASHVSVAAKTLASAARSSHPDRMNPAPSPSPIQIRETADGTLTYLVTMPPEALPQVRARDIEAAWYRARGAALGEQWGDLRIFHFLRADGSRTDLALTDPDAACWAAAADRIAGLTTAYGLSLCLRLLALVALLARARWTAPFFVLERDGARLEPALLAAAAEATLTPDAAFDSEALRARLAASEHRAPIKLLGTPA